MLVCFFLYWDMLFVFNHLLQLIFFFNIIVYIYFLVCFEISGVESSLIVLGPIFLCSYSYHPTSCHWLRPARKRRCLFYFTFFRIIWIALIFSFSCCLLYSDTFSIRDWQSYHYLYYFFRCTEG